MGSTSDPRRATRPILTSAQRLRENATPAKRHLWEYVHARGFEGFKFRRQHPIGSYIVDFYCHAARLVVEIEGEVHLTPAQAEWDRERFTALKAHGFKVLRFRNEDVLNRTLEVLAVIQRVLEPHAADKNRTDWDG